MKKQGKISRDLFYANMESVLVNIHYAFGCHKNFIAACRTLEISISSILLLIMSLL